METIVLRDRVTNATLPDRSVMSPDASWVSKEKWLALSDEDKNKFSPVCPEFVIEVRSKSDSLEELQNKMLAWIRNGAELAWLIDPKGKIVYIYRTTRTDIEQITDFSLKIYGEGSIKGFLLDLSLIRI